MVKSLKINLLKREIENILITNKQILKNIINQLYKNPVLRGMR